MESLQRVANRGSISTGFDVDNSVKFDDGNNTTTVEFFERNVSSAGSRYIGTFSAWIKRTNIDLAQYLFTFGNVDNDDGRTFARFQTDQTLRIGGGQTVWRNTNRVFRDTSAWLHVVIAFDTTQSTANDRIKIYINGVQETSFSTTNNPSQNGNLGINFGKQAIGYNTIDSNSGFNGYMCEVVIQDGVASLPTEFGEFDSDTGIWIPKDASGATMGTNGTYLKFENAASMGAASAGNSFTVQNINQNDQATDTCTNSFAIINTLQSNASKLTIAQGATSIVKSGNHGWQTTNANIAVSLGKWYAEFKLDTSASLIMLGVNQADNEVAWSGSHIGAYSNSTAQGMGYYSSNGNFYRNGGSGAIGSTYTAGDIIGIAFCYNSDGTAFMGMSKNGTWQNSQDPSSGTTNMLALNYGNAFTNNEMFTFAISTHESTGGVLANFGGFNGFTVSSGNSDANGYGNFEYAVPTGYFSLCTKNLAENG